MSARFTALLLSVLVASHPVTLSGEESTTVADEERAYGKYFNGAFFDFSARGALIDSVSSNYGGWGWDVGVRQALVMHLLDTRISYAEQRLAGGTGDSDIVARSLQVHGAFHPLYMALLFSNWFGYLLASWYLEAGIGGHVSTSNGHVDPGLVLGLGSGFDVPVTDPDAGVSLWLNALYRFNWTDFDPESGAEINLHQHTGTVGVSLRFNGLMF